MNQNLPEDPELREIVKSALARKVTRRAVLGGAMATGAAALLAACSRGKPTPAKDVSDSDKTLTWSNWTSYMDVDDKGGHPTLDKFQNETGIKVFYQEDYDDNDNYWGKVKDQLAAGDDIGPDITCPTSWMAARWINQGYVQTFDEAELPNKVNLQPAYLGASYDPDRTMSLPYQGILAGFAFDKKAYKDATGYDAPVNVSDLWNSALKGRVGVLSEMRDTVGIIAMSQGVDITSSSSFDYLAYTKALEELTKRVLTGQISRIKGNSYKDDLVNGDTIVAIAWSGDIIQLNAEAGYDRFGFVLPDSGGTISADCFVIPMGATHKKNAEKLMNFYYDPYNAAVLAAYVNYITPVVGAKEEALKLDPTLAENQLIFPSEEFLAQTQAFRALEGDEEQLWAEVWTDLKLGI